ncbi:hypothetical protein C0129_08900 [Moraxella catarrhalis]|nr:hypothetical protein [Moraxella catarrhalis]MPX57121.1 hypothetical protein [Moraxella catarrhalis]
MVLPVIIIAFADCVNHFNDGKCHHIVPTFITNHHKIRQNLLKSLSKCKKDNINHYRLFFKHNNQSLIE